MILDTPVNPGNSVGLLVNHCGEVVGITTSVIPDAQNIGFSIPINMAKALIPSLIKDGRVVRPWLGFHGQFMENGLQELFRIPLVQGFLIEVVEPASPAEKAGLHGGELELTVFVDKLNADRELAHHIRNGLRALQYAKEVD